MALRKIVLLIFKPFLFIKEFMQSYAIKYRNTFNETLECSWEYNYISLGILKKKETKKLPFKKRYRSRHPYQIIRESYQIPYVQTS
ncbi:hypothetical protein MTsPCn9_25670 [Croceitalea sp. MTPC9]|nr:hypothetical protein MTsPCn6_28860 [Croceitalea sp. MTPC6]GMN17629.1 hypothetical protein MTsPCn9_25670 [Croceitalea sp. MTPC9]